MKARIAPPSTRSCLLPRFAWILKVAGPPANASATRQGESHDGDRWYHDGMIRMQIQLTDAACLLGQLLPRLLAQRAAGLCR